MPSRRKVSYVSEEASPYTDSDVVVIEEDCVSEDEAQLLVRKCVQTISLLVHILCFVKA